MKIEFMYKDDRGNLHMEVDEELAMTLANLYREKIRNLVFDGDVESMEEAYILFKSWHYIISVMESKSENESKRAIEEVRTFSELAKDLGLDVEEKEQEESAEVSDADCTNTAPEDEPSTNNVKYFQ